MTTEAFDIWYQNRYDLKTRQTNPGHRADCWKIWRQAASNVTEYRIIDNYENPFSEPPVPGAVQRTVVIHDVRVFGDPSELPFRLAWYEDGTNHRIVKGCCCRDCGETLAWFVEIPDMKTFVCNHGLCTIGCDFFDQPWIRICGLMDDD